jgi:hypothetical protein
MVSQENVLKLSTIISRGWSVAIEEDDSYVRIYPGPTLSAVACRDSHSRMVCYDPRVGLNILLFDEALICSRSYLQ